MASARKKTTAEQAALFAADQPTQLEQEAMDPVGVESPAVAHGQSDAMTEPVTPAPVVEALAAEQPPVDPEPSSDRLSIASAVDAAISAGISHDEIRAIIDPISDEALQRHADGASYSDVGVWYADSVRAALSGTSAVDGAPSAPHIGTRQPSPPLPGLLYRRVTQNVSGWGWTVDDHRKHESWSLGDVGFFHAHVVDSAPWCFATVD